jgi:hypothetical protein
MSDKLTAFFGLKRTGQQREENCSFKRFMICIAGKMFGG